MKFTDLNFQPPGNYPDSGIAARRTMNELLKSTIEGDK